MSPNEVTRHQMEEQLEAARQAHRREKALLRAPVTAPTGYSKKELRRLCLETKEEFLQRG